MTYCRFQNTKWDLADCYKHLFDEGLSKDEEKARKRLIKMCRLIATETEEDH